MKLNELVCPSCGLKCMTDATYTTCDSCNTLFYANQSRSIDNPAPLAPNVVIWPQPYVYPTTAPVWTTTRIVVGDPPLTAPTSGSRVATDQTGCPVIN